MSLQHTISQNWVGSSGVPISTSIQITGTQEINESFQVPASTSGQFEAFNMSHTAIEEMFIVSDQPVTLSLNLEIFTFTVTSANATVGATYTNNGITFTVLATIAAGTILICSAAQTTGSLAPLASGTLTKASGTGDATITFSAITVPSVPYYIFTCSSANATVGATYTNNGLTFTVLATIAGGTTLLCSGPASTASNGLTPQASGTLTKASGTGDATITFSAVSYPILVLSLLANLPYVWTNAGYLANPFSADIAGFYFTNASVSTPANVQVRSMRT